MSATLMLVFLATLVIGVPIAFTMLVAGLAAVWVQGQLPLLLLGQRLRLFRSIRGYHVRRRQRDNHHRDRKHDEDCANMQKSPRHGAARRPRDQR